MNRNVIKDAIVISIKAQGENNRNVCLITKDGIEYSMLYGGPKSRLRGLVSQWNSGKIFLYKNEAKNASKITDFDVKNYHESFRENLFKSWAANLASEIVLKTKCAGSPKECFILLSGFLDGLDIVSENEGRRGLVRFLWRYLGLLGVRPNTNECAGCGKIFFSRKYDDNVISLKEKVYFIDSENAFFCKDCAKGTGSKKNISVEAIRYLHAAEQIVKTNVAKSPTEQGQEIILSNDIAFSRSLKITEEALSELREWTFEQIQNAIGQKLKSLNSGVGIL